MRPRLRSPALNRVSLGRRPRLNGEWSPTGRQVWIGRLQQLRVWSVPTAELAAEDFTDGAIDIVSLLHRSGLAASRSEGRRAVEQGGVAVDGEKITDPKAVIAQEKFDGEGVVVKKGKKNFRKVTAK